MASVYPPTASLPQNASIVSRWLLDEASGNRADSVGSNTLTDGNTVAAGAGLSKPGGTLFDNSADFEYANSEDLYCNDVASLSPTGAFSVSLWLKPESLTAAMDVINKWDNSNNKTFRLYLSTSGYLQFYVSATGSSETYTPLSSSALSAGTWYHIVCVYRPSTEIEMYINGASSANNTTSVPASIYDGVSKFQISNLSHGVGYTNWIDGLAQDAIFWNGAALTDTEVATLYNLYSNKNVSDTITMSDSTIKDSVRGIIETISLSEVFATIRGKFSILSDAIELADSVIKSTVKSAIETMTLTASEIKSTVREVVDSLSLTDIVEAIKVMILTIQETITIPDTKVSSLVRSIEETITLSETFSKTVSLIRTFSESITITDSFSKGFEKILTDVVSVTDSILKYLNGLLYIWSRTSKPSEPTYTQITKNDTDIWTDNNKPNAG